ncbi:MAG: hypothetical protein ABI811_21235, partial [Acidobacteriota bacterium]
GGAGILSYEWLIKARHVTGHLMTSGGKPVLFVAKPEAAPTDLAHLYARPDDPSDEGISWRQVLLEYNEQSGHNPLGLCPAWRLYENKIYKRLVERFGVQSVYILSAGWGLITASFLTPGYDITYSQSAEDYKRRRKADRYDDFRMLPNETNDEIVFFGGKDYLPLFCSLTNGIRGKRTVFYNSGHTPEASGCSLERFETTTRTNWHYECANAFLDGTLNVRGPQS